MLIYSTNQYFENGIYLSRSNLNDEICKLITKNGVPIISNINDCIEQRTVVSGLEIENFKNIFYIFVFLLFLIYLTFIINLICKKINDVNA